MSKKNLNILFTSIALTIFGLLLDGDVKRPNVVMRFVEFFAMTAIIFMILFAIYKLLNFAKRKFSLLRK